MPATNKFLQFNPTGNNQETDTEYANDDQRTGGIQSGDLVPSRMLNKVLHQVSTLCTALTQVMVNKGYDMADGSLQTLVNNLSGLMTLPELPSNFSTTKSNRGSITFPGGLKMVWYDSEETFHTGWGTSITKTYILPPDLQFPTAIVHGQITLYRPNDQGVYGIGQIDWRTTDRTKVTVVVASPTHPGGPTSHTAWGRPVLFLVGY
jgi:hypothetical protein